VALNFDDTLVEEYRMPAPKIWIRFPGTGNLVLHSSVHMASVNTAAMERAGIVDESFRVPGGTVYFENGRPTGVFEENAMFPFMRNLNLPGAAEAFDRASGAPDLYLSQGVTTCARAPGERGHPHVMRKSESDEFSSG
jgi:predicted amidohydrolase YtcJ